MLNFGLGEILIVGVFVLLFVGPDRLPSMLRFLGRQYGKLRNANNELRRAFTIEADRAEAEARAERLRERREEARRKHEELLSRARAEAAKEQSSEESENVAVPIAAEGIIPDQRPEVLNESASLPERNTVPPNSES